VRVCVYLGSCPLAWKNPSRIHGRKGSLLKVREGKYKGEHDRHRWSLLTERAFLSQVLLKLSFLGREEPGDSHPIINEWGGVWAIPGNLRRGPYLSLLLACLTCMCVFLTSVRFPAPYNSKPLA
jgi:hypothetical protein